MTRSGDTSKNRDVPPAELTELGAPAGLCAACVHALLRRTNRSTTYLRCGLAAVDDRFPRYPRLPVTECSGFESGQ